MHLRAVGSPLWLLDHMHLSHVKRVQEKGLSFLSAPENRRLKAPQGDSKPTGAETVSCLLLSSKSSKLSGRQEVLRSAVDDSEECGNETCIMLCYAVARRTSP
ncbi:uncharacterized protein LOC118519394 [Halichoerus grypus]